MYIFTWQRAPDQPDPGENPSPPPAHSPKGPVNLHICTCVQCTCTFFNKKIWSKQLHSSWRFVWHNYAPWSVLYFIKLHSTVNPCRSCNVQSEVVICWKSAAFRDRTYSIYLPIHLFIYSQFSLTVKHSTVIVMARDIT